MVNEVRPSLMTVKTLRAPQKTQLPKTEFNTMATLEATMDTWEAAMDALEAQVTEDVTENQVQVAVKTVEGQVTVEREATVKPLKARVSLHIMEGRVTIALLPSKKKTRKQVGRRDRQ